MQSEKKKRGRPRKNPLAETSGMTYEGAINYALDKEIKSELETQLSNKSEPLTADEKKYIDIIIYIYYNILIKAPSPI